MFVLDADNAIYPAALGRLVEALDRDPGATFAYPLIAMHRDGEAIGLLSRYAWDPDGFHDGNYIDAMALIRLDDFWALGGYTEDPRLTAWEDFHLWCACAQIRPPRHARPRGAGEATGKADHSMLRELKTDATAAWSVMRARFPAVLSVDSGRMTLVTTLVVRDEEDILEANLEYHFAQGVDLAIVTDHGSRDATPEILRPTRNVASHACSASKASSTTRAGA